ncbi:MAG: benzoate 4-monooxygenase cytochrome P450 [Lasallia pustulata]|uniref:Benzoate 4-monooxygenase cytochrome P450 n=1 Tax=Lasallia pustulata TaxID=136370 RepID=A0A5M8PHK0_9LECA|nr:MAG: benzoate 4-monooxygenase cytochrome P450 [Lasallia pustulata]
MVTQVASFTCLASRKWLKTTKQAWSVALALRFAFFILTGCLDQDPKNTDFNSIRWIRSTKSSTTYFHPLAQFPGPRSWSASRLPFIPSLLSGTLVKDIEKLHREYGPILHIAPNEITFAKAGTRADIFSPRPGYLHFPKDPLWWARQPKQPELLLSVPTAEGHARMRKLLTPRFAECALNTQEPVVQKYVCLLLERLRERSAAPNMAGSEEGVVLDIVPWFDYTTFDIFGDLGYGESFNCLESSRFHPWIALLFNSVKVASFVIAARYYPLIDFLLMKCILKSTMTITDGPLSADRGQGATPPQLGG